MTILAWCGVEQTWAHQSYKIDKGKCCSQLTRDWVRGFFNGRALLNAAKSALMLDDLNGKKQTIDGSDCDLKEKLGSQRSDERMVLLRTCFCPRPSRKQSKRRIWKICFSNRTFHPYNQHFTALVLHNILQQLCKSWLSSPKQSSAAKTWKLVWMNLRMPIELVFAF